MGTSVTPESAAAEAAAKTAADAAAAAKAAAAASNEDVSGLKTKNAELIARVKQLSALADKFKDIDPEAAREALALKAKVEEERHKAEGNYEALSTKLREQHKTELAAVMGKKDKVTRKLHEVLARNAIMSALDGADGDLLMPHIEKHVRVVPVGEDEDFIVQVIGADGKERFASGGGDPFTVQALLAEMQTNPKFQPAFPAKVGSGTGMKGATGVARGGVLRITASDADNSALYRRAKEQATKEGVRLEIVDG